MSVKSSLSKLYDTFINIGTHSEEDSDKKTNTILRNKLVLFFSALTFPYIFVLHYVGSTFLSAIALFVTAAYFISTLFSHLKLYVASKLALYLISDFTLLYYSIHLGKGVDLDLAFLSFIVLPWVLFRLDEKPYVWLCMGISFASFFTAKTAQLLFEPSIKLSFVASTFVSYSVSFASFAVAIATIAFYSNTAKRLNISLKKSIKKLQAANHEVQVKSKKAAQIEAVHQLQQEFLPKIGNKISGFPQYEIDTFFKPSSKEICGDFYDIARYQKQLRGIVGDVQGKGARAGFIAVHYLSFFQLQKNKDLPISEIASLINKKACHIRVPMNYCTTFLWDLDLETQELRYCHAGLEYAYVIRNNSLLPLREGGIQFGIDESDSYGEGYIQLMSNDILFVASDGITDKKNRHGERFGTERLERLLTQYKRESDKALKEVVRHEVDSFCSETEQADDITLFTLTC